jgi:hypothetical protein
LLHFPADDIEFTGAQRGRDAAPAWLHGRRRWIPYDSRRERSVSLAALSAWRPLVFLRECPMRVRRASAAVHRRYDSLRRDYAALRASLRKRGARRVRAISAALRAFIVGSRDTTRRRQALAATAGVQHCDRRVCAAASWCSGKPSNPSAGNLSTLALARRRRESHRPALAVPQALALLDARIRPVRLLENHGIAGNINPPFAPQTGDFVVMLDHDDTLAPFALHALARAAAARPDVEFLYSDCDKLDEKGHRCEPFFKPDWSPELLLGANYLEHVAVFRRSLVDRVGCWTRPAAAPAIGTSTSASPNTPRRSRMCRKSCITGGRRRRRRLRTFATNGHPARPGQGSPGPPAPASAAEPRVQFDDRHPIYNTTQAHVEDSGEPSSRW